MIRKGDQLSIGRESLWEAGMVNPCRLHAKVRECRYTPCTAVQDVACCKECATGCYAPCPMSGRAPSKGSVA